jgi:hypothetical protein
MQPHSRRGRKWRRFNRKYGMPALLVFVIVSIAGLVGLLMFGLTSMSCRVHY